MPDTEMKTPHFDHVLIVGLGLIGGALAYRIRDIFPDTKLYALARRQETVDEAMASGLFEQATTRLSDITAPIDLAIICVPIPQVVPMVEAVSAHFTHPMVITDVASVKEKLIAELDKRKIREDHTVIWGHPMAGSEKTGFANAKAVSVEKRPYIVVPIKDSRFEHFVKWIADLGFQPARMFAADHDRLVAVMSHVPYIRNTLYTENVARSEDAEEICKTAGPGFFETIRRAGSDPDWGVQIAQYNSENILKSLEALHQRDALLIQIIKEKNWDALEAMLKTAKSFKDASPA